jgi:hypothetical protein
LKNKNIDDELSNCHEPSCFEKYLLTGIKQKFALPQNHQQKNYIAFVASFS